MNGQRPRALVLVSGTGTGVGKTWVSARLAEAWRASGARVSARKLAQSFEAGAGPTDAEVLASATGEDSGEVCPRHRWYGAALAPPMAAEALGEPPPSLAELLGELSWPAEGHRADVGMVEIAGGVRSPQSADGDAAQLARLLQPDAFVLVADAELGTINLVRLTADALGEDAPTFVVLNRFEPSSDLHRRNRDWLVERDGFDVTTVEAGGTCSSLAHSIFHERS